MILITGATGNTGGKAWEILKNLGREEEIVTTSMSEHSYLRHRICNLHHEEELEEIFQSYPIRTIIHTAHIRYSPIIMKMANKYGVHQAILVHTTGIFAKVQSYRQMYEEVESSILSLSHQCRYTILRPTMIYGNERDHNLHRLILFMMKWPIFPIFGSGKARMMPVHVEDLAQALVQAIDNPKAYDQAINIAGGNAIRYKDLLREVAKNLNKKIFFIPLPTSLSLLIPKLFAFLGKSSPVTAEQIERLNEDKVFDNTKLRDILGIGPRAFEEGLAEEVAILQKMRHTPRP